MLQRVVVARGTVCGMSHMNETVLLCGAVWCGVLQRVAMCCSLLYCASGTRNGMWHVKHI